MPKVLKVPPSWKQRQEVNQHSGTGRGRGIRNRDQDDHRYVYTSFDRPVFGGENGKEEKTSHDVHNDTSRYFIADRRRARPRPDAGQNQNLNTPYQTSGHETSTSTRLPVGRTPESETFKAVSQSSVVPGWIPQDAKVLSQCITPLHYHYRGADRQQHYSLPESFSRGDINERGIPRKHDQNHSSNGFARGTQGQPLEISPPPPPPPPPPVSSRSYRNSASLDDYKIVNHRPLMSETGLDPKNTVQTLYRQSKLNIDVSLVSKAYQIAPSSRPSRRQSLPVPREASAYPNTVIHSKHGHGMPLPALTSNTYYAPMYEHDRKLTPNGAHESPRKSARSMTALTSTHENQHGVGSTGSCQMRSIDVKITHHPHNVETQGLRHVTRGQGNTDLSVQQRQRREQTQNQWRMHAQEHDPTTANNNLKEASFQDSTLKSVTRSCSTGRTRTRNQTYHDCLHDPTTQNTCAQRGQIHSSSSSSSSSTAAADSNSSTVSATAEPTVSLLLVSSVKQALDRETAWLEEWHES